jgi:hypothetical protein
MNNQLIAAIREAVSDYIGSEGCSCCQGGDHDDHKARLAKLLGVKMYKDKSGYDFSKYRSKE